MGKFTITKSDNEIHVYGHNQLFDEQDIKDLWNEHKILYMKDGIMAVWVEERENNNPLVHLMSEDDGHLYWCKDNDIKFDSHWLDNYIETLSELKNRLSKN